MNLFAPYNRKNIHIFSFRKRGPFLNAVHNNSVGDWSQDEPRSLLRAMSMTVCDLAAITKPWDIEKRVAELVSDEFFQQGDIERDKLNITPIVRDHSFISLFFLKLLNHLFCNFYIYGVYVHYQ